MEWVIPKENPAKQGCRNHFHCKGIGNTTNKKAQTHRITENCPYELYMVNFSSN